MRLFLPIVLGLVLLGTTQAQTPYFPPLTGDTWETLDPAELDWCTDKIDALSTFLAEKNTRSFIVLKNGRIVLEEYYNGHGQSDPWYWASAGKSLMASLVGMAQQDGYLDIDDPTSDYLGEGWTSASAEKEALITIWHQITMTTGLDEDNGESNNCLVPECLLYLTDAGTRWYYYNAPYRLTQDVVEAATGQALNVYTSQRLKNQIGMSGLWLDYVFYSNARSMARFGLLTLNQGNWAGNSVWDHDSYFQAMTLPSQELNPSYGYLWWLNGQDEIVLPTLDFTLPGPLVPEAPNDMYAALGKDDQKIYVVPGQQLVVIRQGDAAGDPTAGPSSFDNQLWERLSNMSCVTATEEPSVTRAWTVYPNPASGQFQIQGNDPWKNLTVFDATGRRVLQQTYNAGHRLELTEPGLYWLRIETQERSEIHKVSVL